ncbi:hypothetical protein VTI74DRAFT_7552 [Chaetomium olivicolor]
MDPDCYHLSILMFAAFATPESAMNRPPQPPATWWLFKRAVCRRHKTRKDKKLPGVKETITYLSLLVPAYAQSISFVGGDLSDRAPYGLPVSDFFSAVSDPTAASSFGIPGYDTSLPAGSAVDAGRDKISGWSVHVGVTANVPLTNSSDSAVDKDLTVDATTLAIQPPAEVRGFNSSAWRVCAVVFTAGLKTGGTVKTDGSCEGALPQECIRQMQVNAVAGKEGKGGGCRDLAVPESCAGRVRGWSGTGFPIDPFRNSSLMAERRSVFFAAGFTPTKQGNVSALRAAERHVWPLMLIWTHFDEDGEVQDSAGYLSCAKSAESKRLASEGWMILALSRFALLVLTMGVSFIVLGP